MIWYVLISLYVLLRHRKREMNINQLRALINWDLTGPKNIVMIWRFPSYFNLLSYQNKQNKTIVFAKLCTNNLISFVWESQLANLYNEPLASILNYDNWPVIPLKEKHLRLESLTEFILIFNYQHGIHLEIQKLDISN